MYFYQNILFMKVLIFLVFLSCELSLNAQNYLITFSGSGASTTVGSVKVENLTSGISLTLNGSDILYLSGTSGINSIENNQSSQLKIYPNPMTDNATIEIYIPESGDASLSIYEITGKLVSQFKSSLDNGQHDFRLTGLKSGLYLLSIKGNAYQYSGKLLSNGANFGTIVLEKISNNSVGYENQIKRNTKGNLATVDMAYNSGDRLKFTGISGNYSTVITDIPSSNKEITFNFIACTDGDNNNYPIVQIGTQIWMAENLKTTKYNDGTIIPNITVSATWAAETTGAYCDYYNTPSNSSSYGRLYNWYTVDNNTATKIVSNGDKNVCPTGWHVPSDAEWTMLTDFLGGELVAGGKLKETGTTHWLSPNTGATNETGFTALPGSYRDNNGTFYTRGGYGLWWSSSPNSTTAFYRYISWSMSDVQWNVYDVRKGMSVQCLKD